MIVSAHQPHYFPCIGYFNKIYLSDTFMLMNNMIYTSKGYISRNRILTNKGWRYLIVPVVKPNGYKSRINELLIENKCQTNWKLKHLRTIKYNYQKGKGFLSFYPIIEEELNKNHTSFIELQISVIKRIFKYLNIETKIILTSDKNTEGKKEIFGLKK